MGRHRYLEAERRLWESVGASPVERWVHLATGERLRVLEAGGGEPLLFVHGASNAGSSWATLAARLPDFRCLLLDRPGCGLSDPLTVPPRDVGEVLAVTDRLVGDVLDALHLDAAHVVASSLGGLFAFRGAAAAPDRVRSIVEFSWSMGAPIPRLPLPMRLSVLPGVSEVTTRLPVTPRLVRAMLPSIGLGRALATGRFDDTMLDWFTAVFNDTPTTANEVRTAKKMMTLRGLHPRVFLDDALLAGLAMPVLFLWGEEDPNGGADVARAFAARFPDADLELLPEAGHAPWIDDPDGCAEAIRRWCRGVRSPRGPWRPTR